MIYRKGDVEWRENVQLEHKIAQAALARYQAQRHIPPITAANTATMVGAEIFALAADDVTQLEVALISLASVARGHAMEIFRSRGCANQMDRS
jgi:hypothetical protein